jgi:hypothetical protein
VTVEDLGEPMVRLDYLGVRDLSRCDPASGELSEGGVEVVGVEADGVADKTIVVDFRDRQDFNRNRLAWCVDVAATFASQREARSPDCDGFRG